MSDDVVRAYGHDATDQWETLVECTLLDDGTLQYVSVMVEKPQA